MVNLPYEVDDNEIDFDKLYYDFTFDVDATWYALRADGRLFSEAAQGPPLVDYPGEPSDNDNQTYKSVVAILESACNRFRPRKAFTNMGRTLTYDEVDRISREFASYLLNDLKLKKGDRVALMLPNLLQYPIAIFGVLLVLSRES